VHDTTGPRYAGTPVDYRIVGVVRDARYSDPAQPPQPLIYTTFLQAGTGRGEMALYARVSGDVGETAARVRAEIRRVDPTLPVFEVHTLQEEMNAALVEPRLIALLSALFGALALTLAGVGVYGLLAFGVARRRRELGIRLALGARRGGITRLVLREALGLLAAGLAIGLPAALAAAHLAASQSAGLLYGLDASDPAAFAAAAAALVVIALVAAYLPARRASRIDPMTALRTE
jgi:predicted lysophospholipase L1 biosynthesis ABC-type transport system permease subunit